jgi:hypothetical protein
MSFDIAACPRCKGTNVVPDINADGSFGPMWCANCKHEFSAAGGWQGGGLTKVDWIVIAGCGLMIVAAALL